MIIASNKFATTFYETEIKNAMYYISATVLPRGSTTILWSLKYGAKQERYLFSLQSDRNIARCRLFYLFLCMTLRHLRSSRTVFIFMHI